MLKLPIWTIIHSGHAEADDLYHDTPAMLKLTILIMTHYRSAKTDNLDHGTWNIAKNEIFDRDTFPT
jgi:hypothetical protein